MGIKYRCVGETPVTREGFEALYESFIARVGSKEVANSLRQIRDSVLKEVGNGFTLKTYMMEPI